VAVGGAARKGRGLGQAGAVRPLAAAMASLQLGPLAPAATAMRVAWSSAPISSVISTGQRRMSYFSGSHYDQEHMREAKNPDLPEVVACPRVPPRSVLRSFRRCSLDTVD
jgi:hypothetical protein